jgi:hypothetical protein
MSGRRASGGRRAEDGGETLIELLVSIVIMGIAGAAIIGSLMIAVDVSQMHKQEVQVQQYLRSWAEAVSNATDASYPCGDACVLGLRPAAVSGLTGSVDGIECWNGADFGGCGARDDVRRVTLTVQGAGSLLPGTSRTLKVVVRRACAAGSTC